jgi:ribosome-associated protein
MTTDAAASGLLRVNRSCVIALDELEWRFSASGGSGGQHVNTTNSKAEVRFDIAGSASLGPRQRERLLEALGETVRVVASDRRSQLQNRELALERLREKLAAALVVQKHRVATKPSKGAKKRRVETKRKRSDVKRTRQRPSGDD